MKSPQWVLREAVLAFHARLLAEFGGRDGLRDEGLLDSALGRHRNSLRTGNRTYSTSRQPALSAWCAIILLWTATNASDSRPLSSSSN
jgi:death-on-curing protein